MSYLHSLISAFIATYFVSRLTWRVLFALRAPWRLVAAHALSFTALAALIMTVKNYFSSFPIAQAVVLIGPALFWLVLDVLRGRASKVARV